MAKPDSDVLAGILRRLASQSEVYRGWHHPIDDEGDEVLDRWLLLIDGEVEVSDEERAAFEAASG